MGKEDVFLHCESFPLLRQNCSLLFSQGIPKTRIIAAFGEDSPSFQAEFFDFPVFFLLSENKG